MARRGTGRVGPLDTAQVGEAISGVGRAVRLEVASQSAGLRRWFAALTVVAVLGLVAGALTVPPGAEVFGTTPSFEWGALIAAYVFFVVTTSGLCLVSSLGMVFGIDRFKPVEMRHVILALLFLVTGFGVIALDLHYPLRLLFGAVLSPSLSSPMWWMGAVYAGYLGILVFELLANLSSHRRLAHLACVISMGFAIVAPATLGMVFSSLVSRPFWQGSATPIYLVITAVLSGASVLGISFAVVGWLRLPGHGPEAHGVVMGIGKLLLVVLAIVIGYTAIRTVAALMFGSPAERSAVTALVSGPLGLQSWLVRVGVGFVAPLLLLTWPGGRRTAIVFVASCLTLVGVFVDRLQFVSAGQISPAAASGQVAVPYATYTPSLIEIGIILGACAAIPLIYTLAERFLDLSSPGGSADVHGVRASGARRFVRRAFGAAQ
jgi:molybdopterin-containing oxidoreductase family membrane subunit